MEAQTLTVREAVLWRKRHNWISAFFAIVVIGIASDALSSECGVGNRIGEAHHSAAPENVFICYATDDPQGVRRDDLSALATERKSSVWHNDRAPGVFEISVDRSWRKGSKTAITCPSEHHCWALSKVMDSDRDDPMLNRRDSRVFWTKQCAVDAYAGIDRVSGPNGSAPSSPKGTEQNRQTKDSGYSLPLGPQRATLGGVCGAPLLARIVGVIVWLGGILFATAKSAEVFDKNEFLSFAIFCGCALLLIAGAIMVVEYPAEC